MKLSKRLTSAILSMTAATFIQAIPVKAYYAPNGPVMYDTVISEWQQRINDEMRKFPDLAYWNNKQTGIVSENTYSDYTPDERYRSYLTQEKTKGENYTSKFFCRKGYYKNWSKTEEAELENGECIGFARKLSSDIWGPAVLIRYKLKNNSYGSTNSNEPFNTELYDMDYTPQIGDIVRLNYKVSTSVGELSQGHSIFITDVSEDGIISFAECNGELNDCQIRWGRNSYYHSLNWETVYLPDRNNNPVMRILLSGNTYSQVYVTKDFILDHAEYYERPGIAGDLNFDGYLNSADAEIFESTIMFNGANNNSYTAPMPFYDVNGDGYVDMQDVNSLRYGTADRRIVMLNEKDVRCTFQRKNNRNGFRF